MAGITTVWSYCLHQVYVTVCKVPNHDVYYHFIMISCAGFVGLNFLSVHWVKDLLLYNIFSGM